VDEIVIERGSFAGAQGREAVLDHLRTFPPGSAIGTMDASGVRRIRIPLRMRPGQQLQFRPEDIILETGDIVYIPAREADVFYTAGLLPAGEYVLPRDTDLDVVEAITRIGGPINSGGVSTTNITGTLLLPGLGNPSPSLVSVVRKTPGGGQVVIRVDLNKALVDRRERILIQPRDVIVLQERPEEGLARYLGETFQFNFVYTFLNSSRAFGTTSLISPGATSTSSTTTTTP
jgi:hypothetical protein